MSDDQKDWQEYENSPLIEDLSSKLKELREILKKEKEDLEEKIEKENNG